MKVQSKSVVSLLEDPTSTNHFSCLRSLEELDGIVKDIVVNLKSVIVFIYE